MTEDIKVTRLSKAAREFNVGISTIVEFLHKKGFDLDPNPNTKLPHEAYILLVKEYSTDSSVKRESEKLILKDLHRKKESVSIGDFSEKMETEDFEKDDNVEGLGHVIAPREHPDYFIFKYKNSNKLYKFIIKHTGYRNTYPQIFVV